MRGLRKILAMLIPFAMNGASALPGEGTRQSCKDAPLRVPTATTFPASKRDPAYRGAPSRRYATPGWRALRESYPTLAAGMAMATALLLLAVMLLVSKGIGYDRELSQLAASASEADSRRVAAVQALARSNAAIIAEQTRRAARGDRKLHLAVDRDKGVMYLEREGAVLREMRVRIGPEAVVAGATESRGVAPPLGKRHLERVAQDDNVVMPGSVRVTAADMEAIRASLRPGMAMYFY